MSESTNPTLWYKLRYAPVSAFLCGQWTLRLDPARQLEASELPAQVRELLSRVVRETGLWRLEKAAVVEELIAHFADGLQSGVPMEQLMSDFGEPSAAAKLIRRAVRRNRPLPWHAMRVMGWCGAGLVGFYLLYSTHFWLGKPSIKTDYLAQLNARTDATPLDQRAWPLYREALLALNSAPKLPGSVLNGAGAIRDQVQPGHPGWEQLTAYLASHQEQIERIRQAAAKPVFGFVLGPQGSAQDRELFPQFWQPTMAAREDLAAMALPRLVELRKLSAFLAVDLAVAKEQGDSRRLVRDAESLLGLARQLREYGVILLDLVSLAIQERAIQELGLTVLQKPALLTDADLTSLAHQLARENSAADLLSIRVERATFEDILQRSFTDDGDGDGRLTPEGFDYVMSLSDAKYNSGISTVLGPAAGLLMSSRKKLLAEHQRLTALAEANLGLPLREADWSAFAEEDAQRFPFALGGDRLAHRFIPSYKRLHAAAERLLGYRDGIQVAISLELYRRRNARYPATLEALGAGMLPQIPADRVTGEPVKFRLVDGSPVVYSVGRDRDDDGGRPALNETDVRAATAIEVLDGDEILEGDWLLFPQVPQP